MTNEQITFRPDRPASPGAYWLRGFRAGCGDRARPALVEVVQLDGGSLVVNLHSSTSCDSPHRWWPVAELDASFEWCGPLQSPAPPERNQR